MLTPWFFHENLLMEASSQKFLQDSQYVAFATTQVLSLSPWMPRVELFHSQRISFLASASRLSVSSWSVGEECIHASWDQTRERHLCRLDLLILFQPRDDQRLRINSPCWGALLCFWKLSWSQWRQCFQKHIGRLKSSNLGLGPNHS